MGILKDLVQTMVVIVILAVFMEMLLPQSAMRRYVKTVMGLLITLAVLQAGASAVGSGFLQDVPDVMQWEQNTPSLDEIMAAGERLAQADKNNAADKYRQGVAQQVLALAQLNPQITAIDAQVTTGGQLQEIRAIKIIFNAAPASGEAITPKDQKHKDMTDDCPQIPQVQVRISAPRTQQSGEEVVEPDTGQQRAAEKVTSSVAQFYNLSPQQVQYEFRSMEKG